MSARYFVVFGFLGRRSCVRAVADPGIFVS